MKETRLLLCGLLLGAASLLSARAEIQTTGVIGSPVATTTIRPGA